MLFTFSAVLGEAYCFVLFFVMLYEDENALIGMIFPAYVVSMHELVRLLHFNLKNVNKLNVLNQFLRFLQFFCIFLY